MLTHPTLLIDQDICMANIERMALKAQKNNVLFRPHFKTHQSAEIGNWFRDFEVNCITVSSMQMAKYFAENGWTDITVAFPANIREWALMNDLAAKINLNIVVESAETIQYLEKKLSNPVGLYIKTDTGYGRTGVEAEDYATMQQLLKVLKDCRNLIFIGFLSHAGHTYNAKSIEEIKGIMETSREQLLALKTFLANDFPLIQLSYGDTPSCSVGDNFEGFDEVRPGNLVFYDLTQHHLGSCQLSDIAVALACPVVAKYEKRGEIIVHGGGVHLSKDTLIKDGEVLYGLVVKLEGDRWDINQPLGHVAKLSQEHGILKVENDAFHQINTGDMVAVLPVHSCLTANLMKAYQVVGGDKISMM